VLVNPKARGGVARVDDALGLLAAGGIDVAVARYGSIAEIVDDIQRHGRAADLIVVCGGDGTLNAAARGLVDTGLPLGILPCGTANDLARTLGIPPDPTQAAAVILAGHTRRIDVGDVNGHPFFNVASIGISVAMARTLTPELKRRWGRLGYAVAALKALTVARPFHATIVGDDASCRVRTLQIAVGNGRHYGGGAVVTEAAAIDDGRLDLYSLEAASVWKLVLMLRDFRRGTHGSWREVRTARGTAFEVRTRQPRAVNADGELVTFTPARFAVHHGAVTVFAPRYSR
jgi:diacylglycerol kinase (ATP)